MRKYITLLLLGFLQASSLLAKQGKEPKKKPKSYKPYLLGGVGVGVLILGGVLYFRPSKTPLDHAKKKVNKYRKRYNSTKKRAGCKEGYKKALDREIKKISSIGTNHSGALKDYVYNNKTFFLLSDSDSYTSEEEEDSRD